MGGICESWNYGTVKAGKEPDGNWVGNHGILIFNNLKLRNFRGWKSPGGRWRWEYGMGIVELRNFRGREKPCRMWCHKPQMENCGIMEFMELLRLEKTL